MGPNRLRVSAYLAKGLKLQILSAPGVESGPLIILERVLALPFDLNRLLKDQSMALRAIELLHHCVNASCSILIVGPRGRMRERVLAGIASMWLEAQRVIALDYPFVASTPGGNLIQIHGQDSLSLLAPGLGQVVVVDDPAAKDWAPLLLAQEALLASFSSASMSLGVRHLLAQITYERPGMVMAGVEALLTSSIDLIVHCNDTQVIGLGEIQNWGSQLAVRAIGKLKDDEFLLDLRESRLIGLLGEAAQDLCIDGIDLTEDGIEGGVSAPLGIAPISTATKSRTFSSSARQVSQSFADEHEARSHAGPLEAEVAEIQVPLAAAMSDDATYAEASAEHNHSDDEAAADVARALESDQERADDERRDFEPVSDEALDEGEDYEAEIPSVAYQLAIPGDDGKLGDDDASPFDEATPALELDDAGELPSESPLAQDAESTMIIEQGDLEKYSTSGDDVHLGTGRPGTKENGPSRRGSYRERAK